MKKITCALLALLIVAALLPVSAAADCDHSFYQAEAKSTSPNMPTGITGWSSAKSLQAA